MYNVSPCLTPLRTSNIWAEKPLLKMQLGILEYRTEPHEVNELAKLNDIKASKRIKGPA